MIPQLPRRYVLLRESRNDRESHGRVAVERQYVCVPVVQKAGASRRHTDRLLVDGSSTFVRTAKLQFIQWGCHYHVLLAELRRIPSCRPKPLLASSCQHKVHVGSDEFLSNCTENGHPLRVRADRRMKVPVTGVAATVFRQRFNPGSEFRTVTT